MKLLLTILLLATPVMAQTTRITSGDAASDGLVAWWSMEEGTGTSVADRAGNGNTGTTTGSPVWTDGVFGSCLNFTNTQYVTIPNSSSINGIWNGGGTLTLWVYMTLDNVAAGSRIVDKANGVGVNYFFGSVFSSGNKLFFLHYMTSGSKSWTTDNSYEIFRWYFVAIAFNRSSSSNVPVIYINGVATPITQGGTGTGSYLADNTESLRIGNMAAASRQFVGKIEDVRMFNRALSAGEISALYHAKKHIYGGQ